MPVPKPLDLPFDPIARAADIWERRFGDSRAMAAVTSIMRVQQILLAELDALLRPHGLTFARYEALVLLRFSREGALPLRLIGQRLMVHPTSVTNIINRLEAQGLVARRPNPADGRGTLAEITGPAVRWWPAPPRTSWPRTSPWAATRRPSWRRCSPCCAGCG